MTETNILERIQKLLALSSSDNPNEAANAATRVQEMLRKHNLKMSEIPLAIGKKRSDAYGRFIVDLDGSSVWRRELLNVIAYCNFCKLTFGGSLGRSAISLIGEPENVEAVKLLYRYVLEQLYPMADTAYLIYKQEDGRVNGRTWRNNFFLGARNVITNRLLEEKQQAERVQNDVKALIVLKSADMEEAMKRLAPKVKTVKQASHKIIANHGYLDGQQAGNQVRLRKEIQ